MVLRGFGPDWEKAKVDDEIQIQTQKFSKQASNLLS